MPITITLTDDQVADLRAALADNTERAGTPKAAETAEAFEAAVVAGTDSSLREVFGDAVAYRTNSGEGADDEDDDATAKRFRALAVVLGVTDYEH